MNHARHSKIYGLKRLEEVHLFHLHSKQPAADNPTQMQENLLKPIVYVHGGVSLQFYIFLQ